MYWIYKYIFPESIEYEYKYMGNYGAKGEKRAKKKKPTPEQVKRQNQINRENSMRRLIKANFGEDDYWCTLKYPAGARPDIKRVKKDLNNFFSTMRRAYKKYDTPFKYIYRMEVGKRGGVHIHIILNRLTKGPPTDKLVKEKWTTHKVNYQTLYEEGGYADLAKYIVKQYETDTQLSMFDVGEQKKLTSYSCSRNLKRPEPEKKVYKRRTLRKLIVEGPQPTSGYYIDKNSIVSGVNPFTGMSYLRYSEIRLHSGRARYKDGVFPWEKIIASERGKPD